jgi:hypothetical protein
MSMCGIGIFVLAIVGIFLAERLRVRILCATLVVLWALAFVFSDGPPTLDRLMVPGVLLAFAAFVCMVVKGYGKY